MVVIITITIMKNNITSHNNHDRDIEIMIMKATMEYNSYRKRNKYENYGDDNNYNY